MLKLDIIFFLDLSTAHVYCHRRVPKEKKEKNSIVQILTNFYVFFICVPVTQSVYRRNINILLFQLHLAEFVKLLFVQVFFFFFFSKHRANIILVCLFININNRNVTSRFVVYVGRSRSKSLRLKHVSLGLQTNCVGWKLGAETTQLSQDTTLRSRNQMMLRTWS